MKEWMENLSEDLQGSEVLGQYDSPEAAFKGLIETKSALGNSLRIPSQEASGDEMEQFVNKLIERVPHVMLKPDLDNDDAAKLFYKSLGVPDAADAYAKPEDVTLSDEMEAGARQVAHELKLTPTQYAAFTKRLAEQQAETATAQTDAHTQAMASLKDKWGLDYDKRMAAAKKLHETFFAESTGLAFENLDPAALPGLYENAKALGITGDGGQFNKQESGPTGMTPGEAQERINEMLTNKDHAFWDAGHPGHQAAVKRMLELQGAAAGRKDDEFMGSVRNVPGLRAG